MLFYEQITGKKLVDLTQYGKCYKIGFFINNEDEVVDGPGHYVSWEFYNNKVKPIENRYIKLSFNTEETETILIGRTGIYEVHGDMAKNKYITFIEISDNVSKGSYLDIYYEK